MKRASPFLNINRGGRLVEDFLDSSSDSGLDDQQSISSTWENSSGPLDEPDSSNSVSSSSAPPVFKVPKLSPIEDTHLVSTTNTGSSLLLPGGESTCSTSQSEEQQECTELVRLQSVLKALLRDANAPKEQSLPTPTEPVAEPTSKPVPAPATRPKPAKKTLKLKRATSTKVATPRTVSAKEPCTTTTNKTNKESPTSTDTKTFSLYTAFPSKSRDGSVELQIVAEPEEQHRARYKTEGSRGAVKDRSGSGFPVVRLTGYDKPAVLQIFIGSDQGRAIPHLFYQASKACGKSSPPCKQRKIQGTVIIEVDLTPEKDMTESCDCVGILKERNVDVEQRIIHFGTNKVSKKRSPKCRMVFRVMVTINGESETLQVASLPITCTQPPGVPEISRQSLTNCSAKGGMDLFLIGKNFLKDSKVVFREIQRKHDKKSKMWSQIVQPDKDFLQPTHLICTVPEYPGVTSMSSSVKIEVLVQSSGKRSEAQYLTFYPEPNLSMYGKGNQTIVGHVNGTQIPSVIQFPPMKGEQQNSMPNSILVVLPTPQDQHCIWKDEVKLDEEISMMSQATNDSPMQPDSIQTTEPQLTLAQLKQEVLNMQVEQNCEPMNVENVAVAVPSYTNLFQEAVQSCNLLRDPFNAINNSMDLFPATNATINGGIHQSLAAELSKFNDVAMRETKPTSFGQESLNQALNACTATSEAIINELILQNSVMDDISNQAFLNEIPLKQMVTVEDLQQQQASQPMFTPDALLNNPTTIVVSASQTTTMLTTESQQTMVKDLNIFGHHQNSRSAIDEVTSMMALLPDSEILNLINNHTFG